MNIANELLFIKLVRRDNVPEIGTHGRERDLLGRAVCVEVRNISKIIFCIIELSSTKRVRREADGASLHKHYTQHNLHRIHKNAQRA